ncbi:hypothetical protein PVAND_007395 [Polypedilum vanderplanki]|uniref:Uncharacterized protein n=1 Tax=Polypedilum vanderplanki TaxID=319348 RepID=A0A9J6C726_POLVA|nr:hypothetical protein PVAND_007395 [Polypedilum vanderplanki]
MVSTKVFAFVIFYCAIGHINGQNSNNFDYDGINEDHPPEDSGEKIFFKTEKRVEPQPPIIEPVILPTEGRNINTTKSNTEENFTNFTVENMNAYNENTTPHENKNFTDKEHQISVEVSNTDFTTEKITVSIETSSIVTGDDLNNITITQAKADLDNKNIKSSEKQNSIDKTTNFFKISESKTTAMSSKNAEISIQPIQPQIDKKNQRTTDLTWSTKIKNDEVKTDSNDAKTKPPERQNSNEKNKIPKQKSENKSITLSSKSNIGLSTNSYQFNNQHQTKSEDLALAQTTQNSSDKFENSTFMMSIFVFIIYSLINYL